MPSRTGGSEERSSDLRDGRFFVAVSTLAGLVITNLLGSGCSLGEWRLRVDAVDGARVALAQLTERDLYYRSEEEVDEQEGVEDDDSPSVGDVIVAELIAIFPGMIVHGLGHLYAGDDQTFGRLSSLGQLGYLLTIAGGGLVVGGYYLDEDDTELLGQDLTDSTAYSLYAAGGVAGGIGLTYFFTAWFYDMIDTPRAVRSGGRPPPRSKFIEALEIIY